MIRCQCPKCQGTFQAPDHSIGMKESCPDCRFPVEIPGVRVDGPDEAPPGRLIAVCPKCRMKFLVPSEQAGRIRTCPECEGPVYVPASAWEELEQKLRRRVMLLAAFGLVLVIGAYTAGWLKPILDHFNPGPGSTFNTVSKRIGEGVGT
jgi:hypothetical protein